MYSCILRVARFLQDQILPDSVSCDLDSPALNLSTAKNAVNLELDTIVLSFFWSFHTNYDSVGPRGLTSTARNDGGSYTRYFEVFFRFWGTKEDKWPLLLSARFLLGRVPARRVHWSKYRDTSLAGHSPSGLFFNRNPEGADAARLWDHYCGCRDVI